MIRCVVGVLLLVCAAQAEPVDPWATLHQAMKAEARTRAALNTALEAVADAEEEVEETAKALEALRWVAGLVSDSPAQRRAEIDAAVKDRLKAARRAAKAAKTRLADVCFEQTRLQARVDRATAAFEAALARKDGKALRRALDDLDFLQAELKDINTAREALDVTLDVPSASTLRAEMAAPLKRWQAQPAKTRAATLKGWIAEAEETAMYAEKTEFEERASTALFEEEWEAAAEALEAALESVAPSK
jgi:hypothetical protein